VVVSEGKVSSFLPKRDEWRICANSINRGTWLGFFLGLIPGTNSAVASFMSYAIEKKVSKHPEKFGTGVIEGVAGPETANNSYANAALIPLRRIPAHYRRDPDGCPHHERADAESASLLSQPPRSSGPSFTHSISATVLLILNLPMSESVGDS
jgi:hypothetical protein